MSSTPRSACNVHHVQFVIHMYVLVRDSHVHLVRDSHDVHTQNEQRAAFYFQCSSCLVRGSHVFQVCDPYLLMYKQCAASFTFSLSSDFFFCKFGTHVL